MKDLPRGTSRVARRRVFYVPGYDPFRARRYRELYRSEAAQQSQISGYRVDVRPGNTATSWRIRGEMDGATTLGKMDVLEWSDIVRQSMDGTIGGTYLALVRTAWTYASTGTLRRLSWLAKGPVLAAIYPVAMLLLQLAVAVFAGFWLGGTLGLGVERIAGLVGIAADATWLAVCTAVLKWVVGLPVALLILRWFKSKDDQLFAHYLMHDYAFAASCSGAYPVALEQRLREFRSTVATALASDVDEVLIVGHSSGAQLAVSLVADLLEEGQVPANGPTLSLLTLGQVIPMVSFLPRADRLRRDLNRLASEDHITWVDVSAPGDGCCFALSDPVAVSGVAPRGQRWPLVISAAFSKTLSPERLKALKYRFFRLHFQYLCAFDQPGDYDYFRITAGPMTLRDRFRRRQSSRKRIDVMASRFSSMVA